MRCHNDLTLPLPLESGHVQTRRVLTYPIAQLHVTERRKQKPREGGCAPRSHSEQMASQGLNSGLALGKLPLGRGDRWIFGSASACLFPHAGH